MIEVLVKREPSGRQVDLRCQVYVVTVWTDGHHQSPRSGTENKENVIKRCIDGKSDDEERTTLRSGASSEFSLAAFVAALI